MNSVLVTQSCAPGLVWRPDRSQCDFPSATSCSDRREGSTSNTMKDEMPNGLSAQIIQAREWYLLIENSSKTKMLKFACIFYKIKSTFETFIIYFVISPDCFFFNIHNWAMSRQFFSKLYKISQIYNSEIYFKMLIKILNTIYMIDSQLNSKFVVILCNINVL